MTRPKPFLDIKHPGLSRTLQYIKQQAQESIPFMESFIPDHIDTPEALFYFLKPQITYKEDPPGIEYIQSAETLINWGYGDCDCFTVLALAGLTVIGCPVIYTVIVGRNRMRPRHIYTAIKLNGERIPFDLTNSLYGFERPTYQYYQDLRTIL